MSHRLLRSALILSCALLGACSTVQPWERGHLAHPDMAWAPDGLRDALNEHVHFSKEASSGSAGLGGGGCGCN